MKEYRRVALVSFLVRQIARGEGGRLSEQPTERVSSKSPSTQPSLLIRIRNAQDREAWEQFVDIYAPLVFGYVRRQGFQDADAADLTQDVFGKVHRAVRQLDYDPQRGKFRGWLLTITRNALRRYWASTARKPQGSGDTAMRKLLEEYPAQGDSDDSFWQHEYHRCLFRCVAKRIQSDFRPSTWQAFWETTVSGLLAQHATGRQASWNQRGSGLHGQEPSPDSYARRD